jgi:hypothetical protein
MSWDNRHSAISSLQELGLLTDAQRLSAVGHERLHELSRDPSSLSTLEWLLRTGIAGAAGLLAATGQDRSGLSAEALADRRSLVTDTLRSINQQSVDALLAEDLIPQEVHQVISESLMTDRALLTPADTMALVIKAPLMSWAEWQELLARPSDQRSAAANAILAETVILVKQQQRDYTRAVWRQVFPGPFWAYLIGAPILLGLVFVYVTIRTAIPGCTSDLARKPINATILMSFVAQRATGTYPSISDLHQIGYNRVREIRGCVGRMTVDNDSAEFGYVIERGTGAHDGDFLWHGADAKIVAARFKEFDANGDFLHKAEPIGRPALEKAFRTGMAAVQVDPIEPATLRLMRAISGQRAPAKSSDPERDPDVEPIDDCRALAAGKTYVCPLMFEWNNPLMAIIGGNGRQVLRGDFTFESGAASAAQPWRVSANFAEEFQRAKVAADPEEERR